MKTKPLASGDFPGQSEKQLRKEGSNEEKSLSEYNKMYTTDKCQLLYC